MRLGAGVVLGVASDSEPFQVQLTVAAGLVALATSDFLQSETRFCSPPDTMSREWTCGPWQLAIPARLRTGLRIRPYARASAVVGFDLLPELRFFGQVGLVFAPWGDGEGDVDYNVVLAFDLALEWALDANTSVVLCGGWAFLDPYFVHGPSARLGLRVVLPDTGPGSARRAEAGRVRLIARRWNRARTDAWMAHHDQSPHPPASMLESRHPVPDWMWSLLGARSAWEPAPRAEEPRDTSTAREESGSEDQRSEDQSPEDQSPEDQSPEDQSPEFQNPEDQSPEESGGLESHGP
ncbi:MAG: hypothetical protein K1X94_18290 [Sandaracinaceae bacterium]|nr:hypothetical protein [Sandaracinaceae bacterium]